MSIPESGITTGRGEIAKVYKKFLGLEEIYPQANVNCASVENLKGVATLTLKWNVPGVLILPGSTSRTGERIMGERLDVDEKGMITRQIGLGEVIRNTYGILDAIRRFSPVSPGAYAVLIQGRNLSVFYNSIY